MIAQEHGKTWVLHSSVLGMIWRGWAFRHLHLVEQNWRIGKGTRSHEVLIGVVREVALIVWVEVVAREVLIVVGVGAGIALVEVVLRETIARVVLRERAVRRMTLAIEALTVTMICKGCVLLSGGRTRSISESASIVVIVAAAIPWTVEGSAASVVVSLLVATVCGRLVR